MAKLCLVPTPIGNLEDITLRSIRILKEADIIFAEDTRVTKKLLNHLEISAHVLPFHSHNDPYLAGEETSRIENGVNMNCNVQFIKASPNTSISFDVIGRKIRPFCKISSQRNQHQSNWKRIH